jgi:hypothetical protein
MFYIELFSDFMMRDISVQNFKKHCIQTGNPVMVTNSSWKEERNIVAAEIVFLRTVYNLRISGDEHPVFYLYET